MGCINPKNPKTQVNPSTSIQVLLDQNPKPSSNLSTVYSKRSSKPELANPSPNQYKPEPTTKPLNFSIPTTSFSYSSPIFSSGSLIKSSSSSQIPNSPKEPELKSLKLPKISKLSVKDDTLNTGNNLSQLLNAQSRFFYLSRSGNLNKKKLDNGSYFINNYKIIGNLGNGTFGKVLKAVDENEKIFAIKSYNKRLLRTRWIGKSKNALDLVLDEIEILNGIEDDGIVKIVEVIEQNFCNKFYVVKEFFNGKNLDQRIQVSGRIREKFEKEADRIWGLIKGFKGLKREDVKVENFLIDDEDNLKFKGFASSIKIQEDLKESFSSVLN